jgi:hypothetical protein
MIEMEECKIGYPLDLCRYCNKKDCEKHPSFEYYNRNKNR